MRCRTRPSSSSSLSPGDRTARWPAASCGTRWTRCRSEAAPLPASLDRGDFFLFGDPERGAAAAGGDHVRVLDLEAGALEALDEVDHRSLDVGKARPIDQQANPLVFEHGVL